MRNLEAQNRKLAEDLSRLKEKWGKDTVQVKAMFQVDLDECRHQLDEAEKEKARLEIRLASLEEELEDLRQEWVQCFSCCMIIGAARFVTTSFRSNNFDTACRIPRTFQKLKLLAELNARLRSIGHA